MKPAFPYLAVSLLLTYACSVPEQPAATPPATTPAPAPQAAAPTATTTESSFSWDDDACHNTGYFAPGRYTQQQLHDSRFLVDYPGLMSTRDIWNLAEMRADTINLRLQHLDAEYQERLQELRAVQVVPKPYWQKLQRLRLLELEEDYRLTRLTFQGYITPGVLVEAAPTPACQIYARALATPDTSELIKAWRQLVDQHKRNNGDPDNLEARFQQQNHSPQRLEYARLELTKFGWWNCVNHAKKYGDVYNEQQPFLAFWQLFTRVDQTDCADQD